ncbi:MG2 domain-containing protein [Candidatus Venteria ishoeyi]|uniref:alpha-2-macroglobulin family protein n=1 Tax=Candidatus Venteria ishoeyi TaxID=1899563 RepID=UPI0025A57478|nr:MG2 domain-containing protein [Candidatus Venteria ishoeyi]MDM8548101.1 MG2 domain-containing protein [Candidatus Venteria ishoeyi]
MFRVLFSLFLSGLLAMQAAWAAFDSADFNHADKPLKLLRITPNGRDVPAGRQMLFQFNQPVVPVGKMERDAQEIPITIVPKLDCQWRWLNTSALACQLSDKTRMKKATRYRVIVQPGIKTEAGATLDKATQHSFITQRPKVSYKRFIKWTAPGMPYIRVSFNQPVHQESVAKALYLRSNGRYVHKLRVVPQNKKKTAVFQRVWIVNPEQELPENTPLSLRVQPGLLGNEGSEIGVEKRDIVNFDSFPTFAFLGVHCTDNRDNNLHFLSGQALNLSIERRCDPQRRVTLEFSTPVAVDDLKAALKLTPDLAGGRKDYDPWTRLYRGNQLDRAHHAGRTYRMRLPELLKAWDVYHLQLVENGLKDVFNRPLKQAADLQFATNHRRPDYHFEHETAVLESAVDSHVPIVVTNLERLDLDYSLLTVQGPQNRRHVSQPVNQAQDIAFRTPLDFRALIPAQSGVVQGRFTTSPPLEREWDNRFFTQVTPFAMEVKAGYHNTLVWVTDLATGLPVADVDISIYPDTYGTFAENPAILAQARTDKKGIAMLPGNVTLDPQLQYRVYDYNKPRLFVHARKADAVALLAMDYRFGVDMYELSSDYSVSAYSREQYGHIHTWGTTAQGVYRAGDSIQYKLLVRDQSNTAFVAPPSGPYSLEISDPTGKKVHEIKGLTLSEFGSFAGEYKLPKTAAVGWYDFILKAKFTEQSWSPLRVLVSDFTPSPFRVQTTLNGQLFKAGDSVAVETRASLHAGGPYVDAHSQVYAKLNQDWLEPEDPKAQGFVFDVWNDELDYDQTVHESQGEVDHQGLRKTQFILPKDSPVLYGKLQVESTVRDDRGKDVASRSSATYVGRDHFVGVKQDSWISHVGQATTLQLLVVDAQGKIAPSVPIQSTIQRRVTKAARVKGAGNAYLTQYSHEWVDAGACQSLSGNDAVACRFTPDHPGLYRLTAEIKDTQSRVHRSKMTQWVAGKGEVLWESSASNRLDITPEKNTYKIGETARYLVKNPFPGAQALITVERFGVMRSWVKTLENSIEIIEVDVQADDLPGYFLSVLVMSPRVDKPISPERVDLGKPAFRMGYVKTSVKDPYKTLKVAVMPDKKMYRPRDQVSVKLNVSTPQGPLTPEQPVEIAVAVLDESVFDLLSQGLSYFDPYKGFYTLDDLDVRNYNLLLKLVGRQKFEKKGANPGGDGGGSGSKLSLRSLFKFVSYWNPGIRVDEQGNAEIQFTVPDNLTGWRVLAMAVTPEDRMGLGHANFKVNQPLELRPVLANQLTVGDQVQAGFSILNRTEQVQDVTMQVQALQQGSGERFETVKQLKLEPYKRQTVWLPVKAAIPGEIQLTAQAKSAEFSDALYKTLKVYPRRSLETGATYGSTTKNSVSESLAFPADIYPDTGEVKVITAPSIIGGVDGAFKYMRNYPYACWEQKLSKGVMASHYQSLQNWLPDTLVWKGSKTLPDNTLQHAAEFQAPNGGMTYFIAENRRVSPYLSAYTALAFNWLRDAGKQIPAEVETALQDYLKTLLRRDVVPDFYSAGMASTVRAVALAALARQNKASLDDLKRYHRHMGEMSLFGRALLLDAALHIKGSDSIRQEINDSILAQAVESGGKISFNETLDDSYTRILATPLRDNCAILSALVSYEEKPGVSSSGLPSKLVRSIVASRKSRTHWENTQENMFCMNALIDYARVYEKDSPDMRVQSWFGAGKVQGQQQHWEKLGETAFKDVRNPAVAFSRPIGSADPGSKATVKLDKTGSGRLYYGVQMSYAPKAEAAKRVNAGMSLVREYSIERNAQWQLLKSPMDLKTGDLIRVDLYLSLPTARNFVVLDDAVPGGLEPVNRDLATASQTAADKAKSDYAGASFWYQFSDWKHYGGHFWSFYHKELRHHAAIFYADYLPAGNYHLSYTAQAIAPGAFTAMPAHAEEMYEPDIYGKSLPTLVRISR